jgi:hypothetical protein
MENGPAGETKRWHRFPKGSVNSTAGTLGDNRYSSRPTHCCAPLRGRSISKNGVGVEALNSSKQDARSHMVRHHYKKEGVPSIGLETERSQ